VQRSLALVLVATAGVFAGFAAYRTYGHPHSLRSTLAQGASAATPVASSAPAAAADASANANAPTTPAVPDTVPDVRLPDLSGQEKSLRNFLGHPLIINFWATWCAPCRREMPLLQQLRHSYNGSGLEVVGIAVDFRSAVLQFLHHQAIDYPLLIGEDQGLAAAQQFGMEPVLPFSVFADAQGQIVAIKVGELHRAEADYIIGAMHSVASGDMSLAQARAGIAQRLKELAIERARAQVKPS